MTLDDASIPRLAPGHRLRHDAARDRWVILAPERLFEPDEIALEVLRLVDGARTLQQIVGELAAKFDAPQDDIRTDVVAMLADLKQRQVIVA